MIRPHKPSGCQGCPLEKQPDYLSPPLNANAKITVLSDHPTTAQCDADDVWAGESSKYLRDNLCQAAGYDHDDIQIQYVIQCRPPKGWELKKHDKVREKAIGHCRQHLTVPPTSEVVVAHGDWAAKYYAKVPGTEDFRGFLGAEYIQGRPSYVVKSTHDVMRQPRMMIPTKTDWKKLGAWRKKQWPLQVPYREIATHGLTTIHHEMLEDAMKCKWVVIDTEYDNKDDTIYPGKLELIGLLFWDGKNISGLQIPWKNCREEQKETVAYYLSNLFSTVPVVMHNLMADVPVIEDELGIPYPLYKRIEDTMLKHALLWSEWPHDLGFLESMYSPFDKMKHLKDTDPLLYNWGDCLSTHYALLHLEREMEKDGYAQTIYDTQSLPLSEPRLEARRHGVRLDRAFLVSKFQEMAERKQYAEVIAQVYCGYQINPGSADQVIRHLQHEGIKLKIKRDTGKPTIDKDALADLRRKYIDYDPEEEKDGITPPMLDAYIERGGHPLIEAVRAYGAAADILSDYITPLLKSDHRKVVKASGTVSPSDFVERVFATQFIHTQTSGRWSTVRPALPLLPPKLRGMLIPDEGHAFIKFDWDQIELRISSALADDKPSLEAFDNKWDIHTLNACDIFGIEYPPNRNDPHKAPENEIWRQKYGWEGKDDKRRVFAKRFVYRLRYRGDPKFATDIPGTKSMGLDGRGLVNASRMYLRVRPSLQTYWNRLDAGILKTRTIRSIYGRKRYLNGSAQVGRAGGTPEICREGSNHPMQASVSDIFNETVVEIYRRGRERLGLRWVYGAHDSQMWHVPIEHVDEAQKLIQEIATKPREINGYTVILPIEFEKVKFAPTIKGGTY